ncbi:MAG: TIGR02587 family membrane protein [Brevundimonas sp.]|uniref:TIGR02587 family membrane protein n=1 Tax=Brevundimonas sp. TaxID=1871086 RepID=UPI002488392B|nr:TIGR02587 family membrane protein [Brevundimonas sp.]MDI1327620.1 TIGR02587 family membrane protein [Brevundimonas sp.]
MTARLAINTSRERAYAASLGRAFGGALIFAFPLLMTMEMWALGVAIQPARLIAFVLLTLPLLYGLSDYAGFNARRGWRNDVFNSLSALAVGFTTAAAFLALFGLLGPDINAGEAIGRITLQGLPAAIGATLARRQLGAGADEGAEDTAPYHGELFLMAAGALVLAFNVAPTEEVILIGYQMAGWQILLLALISIVLLHLLVFSVGFAGQESASHPGAALFRFTIVGYALAILVSLFVLWVFGRLDGQAPSMMVSTTVVLAFPAALGAAVARLLV